MQRYLLEIKTKQSGTMNNLLSYNENGDLIAAELRNVSRSMTADQRRWLWGIFPKHVSELPVLKQGKNASLYKITELTDDLSFDSVWDLYDHKSGSRKRAEALWEKLNDNTRAMCVKKIREYNFYLANTGQKKAHLDTWLRTERWQSEYRI